MTIQVSIDGFRLVADRTGQYEGQTPVQWCDLDGVWREIWVKSTYPIAARVGVLKRGFRAPLYAVAHWQEYVQTNYKGQVTQFWAKMPRLMLAKVAEALALRKAFPNELSGVYSTEEMPPAEPELLSKDEILSLGEPAAGLNFQPKLVVARSEDTALELGKPHTPITSSVNTHAPPESLPPGKPSAKERVPKMLDAFKEHFALEASELEAMLHKPMGELDDDDIKTMEQIFKDLKSEKLTKEDLESIKEVLAEPEDDTGRDRKGMGEDL